MKLVNKLFPYPVLSVQNDDIIDKKFDIDINYSKSKKSVIFNFSVDLTDNCLMELVVNNMASFCIHLECGSTCYREVYKFNCLQYKVDIDCNKINNEVELCFFIVANKDINDYYNPNFNSVYKNIRFSIDKFNILAIGTQRSIIIEKDYDALKNIRSIFTVIPDDENSKSISTDYTGNIIQVFIPRTQFSMYKNISNYSFYIPTIHAVLIVPVLTEIFEMLKRDENAWDEYDDKSWFKSIKKAFEKMNMSLEFHNRENINSMLYAQLIIDSPIIKVFDSLFAINGVEEEQ